MIQSGKRYVNGDLDPRRRGSLPAGHDRHDQRPEGAGGLRVAHGAQQGGSDAAARILLGCRSHAAGAVVERNHHDGHRSRQCGLVDVSAGVGSRVWRKRRHDGNRLAHCTCRRSRVADGRGAPDDLCRGVDQSPGARTCVRGRRSTRRVCACAFWIDDSTAGDGGPGRTVAPGRPPCCPFRSWGRMVVGTVGRALACCRRACWACSRWFSSGS